MKKEEANLPDFSQVSPGGKKTSWSGSEPSVSHVESWKTQLMSVSSGDRGSTRQLKGIRGFWKAISASESQKYDSLSETHMQIQCWQFNLHVLGLGKNCCADLLSKNISWALSKHKVLLITIMCNYMGVLVWKKTKGKTLTSNNGKQKAPERAALVLPAVTNILQIWLQLLHIFLLLIFLPVTLLIFAAQTGISPACEGYGGLWAFCPTS